MTTHGTAARTGTRTARAKGTTTAVSARIAAQLRSEILNGERAPGERIRQEIIAEQYGVSRLPVREALRIVESDGLVTLVANTGAWVSSMNLDECIETYLIRERLDPLLLAHAVPHYTDELVGELTDLARRVEATDDIEEYLRLDRQFHLLSYTTAPMPELSAMVERLWNTTQHYRRAYMHLIGAEGLPLTYIQHKLMIHAFDQRDAEESERLMASHLRHTRRELVKHPQIFDVAPST